MRGYELVDASKWGAVEATLQDAVGASPVPREWSSVVAATSADDSVSGGVSYSVTVTGLSLGVAYGFTMAASNLHRPTL